MNLLMCQSLTIKSTIDYCKNMKLKVCCSISFKALYVVTWIIFCIAHFRQLCLAAASTMSRQWTETQAQVAQSLTTSRYHSAKPFFLKCSYEMLAVTGQS